MRALAGAMAIAAISIAGCQSTQTASQTSDVNLSELIVGKSVTFQEPRARAVATYYADGIYAFRAPDRTGDGKYTIDGTNVCVTFTDGGQRCDRYINVDGTYYLVNQENSRFRVVDISPASASSPSQPQSTRKLAPPAQTTIAQPESGVPPEYAAFLGTWYSDWNGAVEAYAVIENVDASGNAVVTYKWGDAPQYRVTAGEARGPAIIQGDTIRWGTQVKFALKMRPDGKLDAERVAGRARNAGVFEKLNGPS